MTPAELEAHLTTGVGRKVVDTLAPIVGTHPLLLAHTLKLARSADRPRNQKAAYLIRHIATWDVAVLLPYHTDLLDILDHADHPGIRRDVLRVYITANNEKLREELTDRCFHWLRMPGEATAVKYHSMQILEQVVSQWPDLSSEFVDTLESQLGLVTTNFDRYAKRLIQRFQSS